MKASVGRIVHYKVGGQCHAALVIDVGGAFFKGIRLRVFYANGEDETLRAEEGDENNQWHWPERVE